VAPQGNVISLRNAARSTRSTTRHVSRVTQTGSYIM
jgi:hypothetical protein